MFEVNEKGCGGKVSVRASSLLPIPHVLVSSLSSLSSSTGHLACEGVIVIWWGFHRLSVIHCIHCHCPSLHGRRAKWVRASASTFEVNEKGHGGKVSASTSARSSSSDGGFISRQSSAAPIITWNEGKVGEGPHPHLR